MGARRPLDEILAAERLLLTPEETAEVHRVGRTTIYALMKADDVRPVHIGCSCRIFRASSSATSAGSRHRRHAPQPTRAAAGARTNLAARSISPSSLWIASEL